MKRTIVFIALFSLVLTGCFAKGDMKPFSQMTPMEKATFFMDVYSSQAEDYKRMVAIPDLTNEQKQVLREKKKLLTQAYPMISAYSTYVDAGAIPDAATETAITNLINQITMMAIN